MKNIWVLNYFKNISWFGDLGLFGHKPRNRAKL